jgi:hypothetical protein
METSNELQNMGERTKVKRANTNSISLRTTIPEGVVKDLALKEDDTVVWRSMIIEGKVKVVVEKE